MIPHMGRTQKPNGIVVRELSLVDICAVRLNMGAVEDGVFRGHEADRGHPVPRLISPVLVGLVFRVPGQPCAEVEETAVRNA